uniref:(northern house mosquito) hypothetical protein n=1 Tax=Culex pipiens TaxID=7175 RepID=A0A8D8NLR8_CULPI
MRCVDLPCPSISGAGVAWVPPLVVRWRGLAVRRFGPAHRHPNRSRSCPVVPLRSRNPRRRPLWVLVLLVWPPMSPSRSSSRPVVAFVPGLARPRRTPARGRPFR